MSVRFVLREKGFSLLELSVTLGLMGLVSLFTMKVMEGQTTSKSNIEATAEVNMTVSTIAQTINDPTKCASMFYNQVAATSGYTPLNGLRYTIQRPSLPPAVHQLLETRAGQNKVYQHFYIDNANDIRLTGDIGSGTATLTLVFSVQPSGLRQRMNLFFQTNPRTIIRHIPFNVVTDAAQRITSCGPVVSTSSEVAQQNACSLLSGVGAYWNTTHPLGPRCQMRPQAPCPFNTLPRGYNATGHIICEPAQNVIRAEDIFDLSHSVNCNFGVGTHRWVLVPTGPNGRLRIHCHL